MENGQNIRRNNYCNLNISNIPNKYHKFIQLVYTDCQYHKIKLRLVNKKNIKCPDGVYVSGYFDEEYKTLKVAVKNSFDYWFPVLVHEYGHLLQWAYDKKMWNCINTSEGHSVILIENWLNGKKINNITKHINNIRRLEIDCEKKVVSLIQKYNLPINIKEYIKSANAYIYLYTWLKYTRKWCIQPPYTQNEILEQMPTTFIKNYGYMSKKNISLYNKYCL
jgi:hypothetical protein